MPRKKYYKLSSKVRYLVSSSRGNYGVRFKSDADDLKRELKRRGYKVKVKKL